MLWHTDARPLEYKDRISASKELLQSGTKASLGQLYAAAHETFRVFATVLAFDERPPSLAESNGHGETAGFVSDRLQFVAARSCPSAGRLQSFRAQRPSRETIIRAVVAIYTDQRRSIRRTTHVTTTSRAPVSSHVIASLSGRVGVRGTVAQTSSRRRAISTDGSADL